MNTRNKPWSDSDIETLIRLHDHDGLPFDKIGEILGRSAESCRWKFRHLPRTAVSANAETDAANEKKSATVEEDRERTGNVFWQREYKSLETKYEKVLREQSVVDQLVALATELAPRSYAPAPPIYRPNAKGGKNGKPQSAVLMLSDTHVGQVIEPDQTLGFGRYNFSTFLARLKYLEESVASILQDHTTTEVEELVVCLGGDMIDGALNHGAEAGQKNTLFTQFYNASHAIAQFLRNIAPLAPRVRVYCAVGNHPRWANQHKMPTNNRYSNLDAFLYAHIQALTSEIKTIDWTLNSQPFALFDVQGFQFHLSHGDHLRGGDKALGIPNHAVGRMISSTTQLFGKAGAPSPHYYLVGHLHRSIVLPHARGSVVINGGFAGLDGYGLSNGFSPVDPSQVFFLVHPRYGKTATYDIWLRHAVLGAATYDIPGNFPIL